MLRGGIGWERGEAEGDRTKIETRYRADCEQERNICIYIYSGRLNRKY